MARLRASRTETLSNVEKPDKMGGDLGRKDAVKLAVGAEGKQCNGYKEGGRLQLRWGYYGNRELGRMKQD